MNIHDVFRNMCRIIGEGTPGALRYGEFPTKDVSRAFRQLADLIDQQAITFQGANTETVIEGGEFVIDHVHLRFTTRAGAPT